MTINVFGQTIKHKNNTTKGKHKNPCQSREKKPGPPTSQTALTVDRSDN